MRILLLGASGLLGGVLYQQLSRHHEVVGTTTRHITGLHRLDLTDPTAIEHACAGTFNLVVHCAGIVDLHRAEQEPALTERVHVRATEELVATTATKIVYFSTDNVFSGRAPRYIESDLTGPVSVYGRTKLAAERIILRRKDNLVIRVPLLFGFSPWSTKFIDRFRAASTPAVIDVVTNPLYLPDIAEHLTRLWSMSGIVHVGGATAMSRFEFMNAIRAGLHLPTDIVAIRNSDIDPTGLRPPRLVLESARHPLVGRPVTEAIEDMRNHV
ncbi:SDR family oxidoreductase [Nocardia sp. NPDC088792]|uniref:SDR family oxidoreductase n=1 Tax=Nocardia sp. NPDC088792 TaxID=3364332 RepID=UPI00381ED1B5